jgi:hypothetical protein
MPQAMPPAAMKHLLTRPKVPAPLDANFAPVILAKRAYLAATKDCKDKLDWALPRADGCARYTLPVFPDGSEDAEASVYLAGVLIQEMIWQRSASELQLSGPPGICEKLKAAFSAGGTYAYEVSSMPMVCGTPGKSFDTKIVASPADMPPAKDTAQVCGKEANGNRLAFDLGKSDIKTVAIKDGEVLDSMETEWDVTNPDPQYHFDAIVDAMKKTIARAEAKGFGKIQAVGGSATGTVSGDNDATWCDIFPNVPPDVYKEKVVDIFKRIAKEVAGDVPLKVINDGEVTALAAVQKLGGKGKCWASQWAAAKAAATPMGMATSWAGSTSCATSGSISIPRRRQTHGPRERTRAFRTCTWASAAPPSLRPGLVSMSRRTWCTRILTCAPFVTKTMRSA